ncbi:MAG: leucine-rich repeat domain-containing protein [Paludibacteraceae bacterium]|nr:leucine-rich repeat domain-containing protein [Paludibacteraceae bacterium]
MKTKIFTLFLALVASAGTILASNTQVDGIWYDFDSSTKTASVTYRGSKPSTYSNEYSGAVVIPASITYNSETYNVTSVGENAFYECRDLTSVTIPNSVTSIGENAFAYCYGMTSVTIGNSVTSIGNSAFYSCASLTSIEIPNSVTSIGDHAFYGCRSLTSVIIGVTSIGDYAFKDCTGLTSLTLENSVESIGKQAFENDSSLVSVTIPNSVTSIGDWAFCYCYGLTSVIIGAKNTGRLTFSGCSGLTSVTIENSVECIGVSAFASCTGLTSIEIPNSVTSIGEEAFWGCTGLTSIEIPNSVTSIGGHAFYHCRSLTSVTIGNSVTSIGEYAFYGCNSLTSVAIGNSVESIEKGAFKGCTGLTSIEIPNNVTSIKTEAFLNCTGLTSVVVGATNIGRSAFGGCSSLTSLTLENSVESIGDEAFKESTGLMTSITIPYSLKSIGQDAFKGGNFTSVVWNAKNCNCYHFGTQVTSFVFGNGVEEIPEDICYHMSVRSVTIPNSVKSIGDRAFESCGGLNSVVIGNSVTSLGYYAFMFCTSLTSVTCLASTPPVPKDNSVFDETRFYIPLYVPAQSIELYKTASHWDAFGYILPVSCADETATSNVTATPSEDNSVILEWPAVENAVVYTIDIKKNGELICTLEFDENGLLISKRYYMPSRNGESRQTPAATQTAKGWRYKVEGLEAGAKYTYTITAKKNDDSVLFTKSIDFTMPSSQGVDQTESNENMQKVLRDGQVLILRGEHTYDAQGKLIK